MTYLPDMSPVEMYEKFYGPMIFQPCAEVLIDYAPPKPGEIVLDLACGTGIVTRLAAAKVSPGGRVVGVDINPDMLAAARRIPASEGAQIEWIEGGAGSVELPGSSFDLVTCQQGLQFFKNPSAALTNARRVLKQEGRIALALWRDIDHHPVYKPLTEIEAKHLGPLGVDYADIVAPFSLGESTEIRRLLKEAGFTSIDIIPHSITIRSPSADTFIHNLEYAYAAVIPQFMNDPQAFWTYLKAVSSEMQPILQNYRDGDGLVFPMPTYIATACPI
jgi:ubiquinone/menaquinone biosynthesis C-methylase UbiE